MDTKNFKNIYHKKSHCVCLIQYHIIWTPKFRFSILKKDIENDLRNILIHICNKYGYIIKALEIMPDHIHIFIDCPQTVSPCDIVRTLKSISAIELFKLHPELKRFYAKCGVLWKSGYFISTVGKVSEITIKKYIEEQKTKD